MLQSVFQCPLSCFLYNICFPSLVFFFSVGQQFASLTSFITFNLQPKTSKARANVLTSPPQLHCAIPVLVSNEWSCFGLAKKISDISSYYLEKWKNTDNLWVCGWTSVLILCDRDSPKCWNNSSEIFGPCWHASRSCCRHPHLHTFFCCVYLSYCRLSITSKQPFSSDLASGINNTFLPRELDFCSFPDRPL